MHRSKMRLPRRDSAPPRNDILVGNVLRYFEGGGIGGKSVIPSETKVESRDLRTDERVYVKSVRKSFDSLCSLRMTGIAKIPLPF